MTSTLLVAVALVAAPEAQSPQNLDWLVGHWRQPPSASPQWLELTWTPTPVGFRGVIERVRNDGTRASEETYEIEIRDPLKLTWRHAPDASGPPVQDVFEGSAGPGSHVEFFWVSRRFRTRSRRPPRPDATSAQPLNDREPAPVT